MFFLTNTFIKIKEDLLKLCNHITYSQQKKHFNQ